MLSLQSRLLSSEPWFGEPGCPFRAHLPCFWGIGTSDAEGASYDFPAVTLGVAGRGTLLAACFLLTACAKSPSSIAPVAVDSQEYSHLDCEELVAKHREISSLLDTVSSRQNDKQVMDALSVLVILVPASALAGDEAAKIAQFKGEKLALERGIEKRGC